MSTEHIDDIDDDILVLYEDDPESVVVCPICDMMYQVPRLEAHQTAHCARCHSPIAYNTHVEVEHTIALAFTSLVLMYGAVQFEFMGVSASGLSAKTTLVGVIEAFSEGWYLLLGIFVACFVIALPVFRALSLIYVLWPIMFNRAPFANARLVFTVSQRMGPWLMTEIFIIGVAVALVKIVGMASVELGASFWIFCLLVVCLGLMNATVHRRAVWDLLGGKRL